MPGAGAGAAAEEPDAPPTREVEAAAPRDSRAAAGQAEADSTTAAAARELVATGEAAEAPAMPAAAEAPKAATPEEQVEADPAVPAAGAAIPADSRAAAEQRPLPSPVPRNKGIRFSRAVRLFRRWDRPN